LIAYHVNRRRCTDGQRSARAIGRASRNKTVPDPGHAPYPLRTALKGRDDYRRRGIPSTGAGSDLIEVRLRRTVRSFLDQIVTAGTAYCPGGPAEVKKLLDTSDN
jgi:hypothetical protein